MRRVLFLAGIVCLVVFTAKAQDPVKVAGDVYKVIVENDSVRALDVKIAAGAKTAMHSHPDLGWRSYLSRARSDGHGLMASPSNRAPRQARRRAVHGERHSHLGEYWHDFGARYPGRV